MCLQIHKCTNY